MTYRELIKDLKTLKPEQLDQHVTVHLINEDEFVPVQAVGVTYNCDVLADDHIILGVSE